MSQSPAVSASCALVMDDNSVIRMGAMDVLEEAGFRALEARNGDEALRKASAEPKSTLGGPKVDQLHSFIATALRRDLGL